MANVVAEMGQKSERSGDSVSPYNLLEALPDPAALLGPDGCLVHASASLLELVGQDPTTLLGQALERWETLIHHALCPLRSEVDGADLEEAPGPPLLETRTFPRRVFSRQMFPVQGSGVSHLLLFRDVTREHRASEELRRAQTHFARETAALQNAERFRLDVTANVTHDLRTPLASIKASVSGLLAGDVEFDPTHLRETLVVIEEETDRLQRRVSNLLSMARMESGDAQLEPDWVDLADVVSGALEALRPLRNGRPVHLDLAEDLPLVRADYDQLQIAIRNLLENAFLYSPSESRVEVSASVGLGQLRLRIRDYGPGLMPDEFDRVFDKFYRGRNNRRIPGTGLGLPICRGIAEAHGGRLWAEHVPGGGVQFVLSLPLEPEATDWKAINS